MMDMYSQSAKSDNHDISCKNLHLIAANHGIIELLKNLSKCSGQDSFSFQIKDQHAFLFILF